jgi:hypothetical protein
MTTPQIEVIGHVPWDMTLKPWWNEDLAHPQHKSSAPDYGFRLGISKKKPG